MKLSGRSLPALVISLLALVLSLSGGAYAAGKIQGKQIAKNSITSAQVKDGTLVVGDLSPAALGSMQGRMGPAGSTGATGATGATGPKGDAGPAGQTGATGPAGPIGATGATGAAGPAGPAGPTGATGPTGAPGPAGVLGLQKVEVNATIGGNSEQTVWVSCPTTPSVKTLIGWALGPSANIDDLYTTPKYVYNSFGLPGEVGVRISNVNAGINSVTVVGLCASQS